MIVRKIFENQRQRQFQTAFAPEQNYKLLCPCEEERIKPRSLSRLLVVLALQVQADPRTHKLPAGEAINE